MEISENALVTLLLCSDLAVNGTNPLSDAAYSALAGALFKEDLQPQDLLTMSQADISQLYNKYRNNLFSRIRTGDFHIRIPGLIARRDDLLRELSELEKQGIQVLTRADKDLYPGKVRRKFLNGGIAYPAVIFYCGDLSHLNNSRTIAVVGSRNYEQDISAGDFTRQLIKKSVQEGWITASGGARGIDQLAFDATVQDQGKSIITVADSLCKKIADPAVKKEIVKGNALFMSLADPYAGFSVYNAMARNKMIYAVSDYALVVTCECYFTKNKKGEEVVSMTKGGTWAGALECAAKNLSRLVVRKSDHAFRGNSELINKLKCLYINEERIFSGDRLEDIFNFSADYQQSLF